MEKTALFAEETDIQGKQIQTLNEQTLLVEFRSNLVIVVEIKNLVLEVLQIVPSIDFYSTRV